MSNPDCDWVLVTYHNGKYHLRDVTMEHITSTPSLYILSEMLKLQGSGCGEYKLQRQYLPSWDNVPKGQHKADLFDQKMAKQGKLTLKDLLS